MITKFARIAAAAALVVFVTPLASQAAVLGSSVTGELYFGANPNNYFDPANGFVPATTLNNAGTTVVISDPAVEFGFVDALNTDLVDFFADGVTITDDVDGNAFPWVMIFTSDAFIGLMLLEVSDNFLNGGITGSLIGDTLTFSWAGIGSHEGLLTAEYRLAPVPLPAALPLFGGALLGAGAYMQRKRRKASFSA